MGNIINWINQEGIDFNQAANESRDLTNHCELVLWKSIFNKMSNQRDR